MYLLIQARDDDYMRQHELQCFARAAGVPTEQFELIDCRQQALPLSLLDDYEAFFIGGSGEYCVSKNLNWLEPVEAFVREAAVRRRPLLGVCFGFHILARAYGAQVKAIQEFSETGTFSIHSTEAGRQDRLFATLPSTFYGHEGHNDTVLEMTEPLVLLAASDRCPTQACVVRDTPVYGIQFHPELRLADLKERLAYYGYVNSPERAEQVRDHLHETPETETIIRRFLELFVTGTSAPGPRPEAAPSTSHGSSS